MTKYTNKEVINALSNEISNFIFNGDVSIKRLDNCYFRAKEKLRLEIKELWEKVK
jgi:hypothetical protein